MLFGVAMIWFFRLAVLLYLLRAVYALVRDR